MPCSSSVLTRDCLRIMCRRLCKMLAGSQSCLESFSFMPVSSLPEAHSFLPFHPRFRVHTSGIRQILILDAATVKPIVACCDPSRRSSHNCRLHPACRKALPDQLIQTELISASENLSSLTGVRVISVGRIASCASWIFLSVFRCLHHALPHIPAP